ncbi:MAG: B12-binding domain-containing radical SAM protein [Deltaproteobacteria bacterium]|nr:B12-binding domain-containing radical SAM protein [Deltaproteobacteria bacterium]
MKILLVNPPTTNVHVPENTPLGLLYLAQAVRDIADPWVIDFDAMKLPAGGMLRRLTEERPDLLGITCTTYSFKALVEITRFVREQLPETRIVIGGPHVTAYPEQAMKEAAPDWIITREGELAFRDLVLGLKGEQSCPAPGSIIEGTPLEPIERFGFPARDLLEPGLYGYLGNHPRHVAPEAVMLWGRGCPHKCTFCSDVVFMDRKTRFRPADAVLDEIGELKRLGFKEIFVYDDELAGMNPVENAWIAEICRGIIARGYNDLVFKCQGRCSKFATQEMLDLMAEAGFRTIMWGVESGSPAVLRAIRKGTTREAIEETMERCRKAGIERWMFLIIGFPQETASDLQMTCDLVEKVKPEYVQVTFATPYPSALSEQALRENRVQNWDIDTWNTHRPVIRCDHLTDDELIAWREKILAACDRHHRVEPQPGMHVAEEAIGNSCYSGMVVGLDAAKGLPSGDRIPPRVPQHRIPTWDDHWEATKLAWKRQGLGGIYQKAVRAFQRRFTDRSVPPESLFMGQG